jgi:energy-coupling factor transporter ATP-binding protein EcfA2
MDLREVFEGIAVNLVSSLIAETAGAVRRKLKGDPAESALRAAISEALESAFRETGLSPQEIEHNQGVFQSFFRDEDVLAELSLLIDPRPDRSLDIDRLAAKLESAGLDPRRLIGFDFRGFLISFGREYYAAVAREEPLQGLLNTKMLGEIVARLGDVAGLSERAALASERTEVQVEGLRREIQAFIGGSLSREDFFRFIYTQTAGFVPALDGLLFLGEEIQKAGYTPRIDPEGQFQITDGRSWPPALVEALAQAATRLRQVLADRQPSDADLDALADRYRRHLIDWFQSLTFQGLAPSVHSIVLRLEEIYVELRVVAEMPDAADSFSADERRILQEADGRDAQDRDELLRNLERFRRDRWSRSLPERKPISAALYQSDQRAAVILGDPGSGKTTLLHFLALVHARGSEVAAETLAISAAEADRLPIFVPLAAFEDMLRERPGLTLVDFLASYYDRRRGLPGLGPLFRRALESGRALVLLDGIDEVLDPGTRSYVAQQVGALIGEWSPRGVRFAVSSRFVGYLPVSGNPRTFSVLEFGEREIEVFTHRWAHAYERWVAGEGSAEAVSRARTLEKDLLADVRSNESVRRLAANPLMLTLLALLRRQVSPLPRRRIQLYDVYVSTLLDNWLGARSPGAREKAIELDGHRAKNILISLALWLQREKPSGTAGRVETERKLVEILLEEKGYGPDAVPVEQVRAAEEQARRFLHEMRALTGLFVERGYDAFGFLHLTFQEFFAGRALARLGTEERWRAIRPHLHDSGWREPILLCAGWLGIVEGRRPEVTALVRQILDHQDPAERYLHRNLLLALAIAGDDVGLDPNLLNELKTVAGDLWMTKVYGLGKKLVRSLCELLVLQGEELRQYFGDLREIEDAGSRRVLVDVLGELRPRDLSQVISILEAAHRDEDFEVRRIALQSLSNWAGENQRARTLILDSLRDTDYFVKSSAIEAVKNAVAGDVEIRQIVLDSSEDEDLWVRVDAAECLASAVEDSVAQQALVRLLDDEDDWVRETAVEALASLVETREEIRSSILSRVDGDSDVVRRSAVKALARIARVGLTAREALERAMSDEDELVRNNALRGLVGIWPEDRVLEVVDLWGNGRSVTARHHAAEFIGDHPGWLELPGMLESIQRDQRVSDTTGILAGVLVPLAERMPADGRVRELITAALKNDLWRVRNGAVLAMAGWPWDETRNLFVGMLDDGNYQVRRTAAKRLAERMDGDPAIRGILLERFGHPEYPLQGALPPNISDKDLRARIDQFAYISYEPSGVAEGLARRVRRREDFRVKLIEWFRRNVRGRDQSAMARTLAHGLDIDERVEETVIWAFSHKPFSVRLDLADELSRLDEIRSPAVLSQLRNWLCMDSEPDYREFFEGQEEWAERMRTRIAAKVGAGLREDDGLRTWVLQLLGSARMSDRLGGALALLSWPGAPSELLDGIFAAIEDPRDLRSYRARLAAASLLIDRRETAGEALGLCLEALDYGTHPWEHLSGSAYVRKQAVEILGGVKGPEHSQRAYERLVRVIEEDKDPEVRDAAYDALVRLAGVRERQAG